MDARDRYKSLVIDLHQAIGHMNWAGEYWGSAGNQQPCGKPQGIASMALGE